ncbi:hypothetical protein FQR65_LT15771 [Abscondita terminalis]|nr:hypothetical protein FQR65_LT15771 [Abscondita terminalis]
MTGNDIGKSGHKYLPYAGFCLETQHYPDSPNQPEFPTTSLKKGEVFTSETHFKFSIKNKEKRLNKVVVRTPDVRIYTDYHAYNSVATAFTYSSGPDQHQRKQGRGILTRKKEITIQLPITVDKFYANGGYGLYKQSDESITMTDKPLVTMVIKKDSTSTSDSTSAKPVEKEEKSKKSGKEKTVEKKKSKEEESFKEISPITPLFQQDKSVIFLKDYKALDFKLDRNGGLIEEIADEDYGDDDGNENTDSLSMSGNISGLSDSTQTDSVHIEGLKSDSAKNCHKASKRDRQN